MPCNVDEYLRYAEIVLRNDLEALARLFTKEEREEYISYKMMYGQIPPEESKKIILCGINFDTEKREIRGIRFG